MKRTQRVERTDRGSPVLYSENHKVERTTIRMKPMAAAIAAIYAAEPFASVLSYDTILSGRTGHVLAHANARAR